MILCIRLSWIIYKIIDDRERVSLATIRYPFQKSYEISHGHVLLKDEMLCYIMTDFSIILFLQNTELLTSLSLVRCSIKGYSVLKVKMNDSLSVEIKNSLFIPYYNSVKGLYK